MACDFPGKNGVTKCLLAVTKQIRVTPQKTADDVMGYLLHCYGMPRLLETMVVRQHTPKGRHGLAGWTA
jgi:hypothetical protein